MRQKYWAFQFSSVFWGSLSSPDDHFLAYGHYFFTDIKKQEKAPPYDDMAGPLYLFRGFLDMTDWKRQWYIWTSYPKMWYVVSGRSDSNQQVVWMPVHRPLRFFGRARNRQASVCSSVENLHDYRCKKPFKCSLPTKKLSSKRPFFRQQSLSRIGGIIPPNKSSVEKWKMRW